MLFALLFILILSFLLSVRVPAIFLIGVPYIIIVVSLSSLYFCYCLKVNMSLTSAILQVCILGPILHEAI